MFPVHIPQTYDSRYALLGAMARELAEAFAARGCPVNPPRHPAAAAGPGLFVFFNFLPAVHGVEDLLLSRHARTGVLQVLVDHPLALDERLMDQLAPLPTFRLVTAAPDGAHLLRLRWPALRHAHVPHAISPAALCDEAAIEPSHTRPADRGGRPVDLAILGSIHTEAELAALRAAIPAPLRRPADDAADLMARHPALTFEDAADLTVGAAGTPTGQWGLLALLWRYVIPAVNRSRRLALLGAMQGVSAAVHGPESWAEHCTGTLRYAGPVAYREVPRVLAGARAHLALGPTQFAHAFSERLLLSMAAGCATVADDRVMIGRHFGPDSGVATFPAGEPGAARAAVDRLLSDPAAAAGAGLAARRAVADAHLWAHRLPALAAVGGDALAA
ncbi:MAG: glycosyltransferase family 1 protein [Phycisphaerales bacterium]|nr:glycosyltransferase family 1 protein [Phycisphaerales bacterium]